MVSDALGSAGPKVEAYGLIIGVNKYQRNDVHQELMGSVDDAMSVFKFFTEHLNVPEDRFVCLFNEYATRDAIIKTFMEHLINNPAIRPYDPIVIYFAGHGDRMPAPRGWQSADGKVEMILPHDANTYDAHGQYNYGIPDLTLAFLLYKLSQEKGNNITVILDSCHSGSGTRGEVRLRSSHDPECPPIPDELDAQLRRSLSIDYPSEVEKTVSKQLSGTIMAPSLESHILLAACQEDEQAQEAPNRDPVTGDMRDPPCTGIFTMALLKELRRCNITTTSYITLIRNLLAARRENVPRYAHRMVPQTFQCEGRNQDRLLFSVQYSMTKGKIALIPTSDKAIYRVRVGSAQGIVPGTEFGIFSSRMDPKSPPAGILVARDVGPIISQLHGLEPNAPPEIPEDAYATIVKFNDHSNGVRIWLDKEVEQLESWKGVRAGLHTVPVFWATSPDNHDVALLPAKGGVELQGAHLTPGRLGTSHILKPDLTTKQIVDILTSVVYFHFHLKNQNPRAPVRPLLGLALRELKEKTNSWGSIIYEVNGNDMFGESVSAGTVATLRADPNKVFGLELTNNSQEDLFPYVLYYDFEDYSVGALYEPPGRTVRAPLQAGRTLTIGYGSGGSQPFQVDFTNPKSEKEYGAFLLLVFSEWVDIAYLQQESPLNGAVNEHRGMRALNHLSIWDSVIVRVEMIKP
ncbi:unnamed protein product [Rhizoctonia solani]|uniref:Peptidase C14 caspase domain-containing protein n=1 Tax=Rhizoctonia solani TaxID=456999 RepID=A0A8H3CWC9_9AGAM|nr:unnamed protein product [Rhizoctonia solani]